MVKLRHFFHPIKSAKGLFRRGREAYYRRLGERFEATVPRRDVNQCWCGGSLLPITGIAQYGACESCGCYVNRRPPTSESLKEIYSLDNYWRVRQRLMGVPPIEKRADFYRDDGRIGYWLNLIEQYGPTSGTVIEIGCAPGALLSELERRGFDCIGVEADASVADWIRRNAEVKVEEGLFPWLELPSCDLFLAFDVAEHTSDPIAFWVGIANSLKPGGKAIIQTPIEYSDYAYPFKTRREFFDGLEHLYLYTDTSVRKLAQLANLELTTLGDAKGGYLSQLCILSKSANNISQEQSLRTQS